MNINKKMAEILGDVNSDVQLSKDLWKMANSGFVNHDECWFLGALSHNCRDSLKEHFADCIDYERFVNSFHVEDYAKNDVLSESVLFCKTVLKKWKDQHSENMRAVLSVNDGAYVVHFYLTRGDVSLYENVEDFYLEALMVIDSRVG